MKECPKSQIFVFRMYEKSFTSIISATFLAMFMESENIKQKLPY